ncbi:MAG: hypothetical protein CL759_08390 [Chloroflexi bacterium]|nr:hypothetical protein [Chloroflexota bacterium]
MKLLRNLLKQLNISLKTHAQMILTSFVREVLGVQRISTYGQNTSVQGRRLPLQDATPKTSRNLSPKQRMQSKGLR